MHDQGARFALSGVAKKVFSSTLNVLRHTEQSWQVSPLMGINQGYYPMGRNTFCRRHMAETGEKLYVIYNPAVVIYPAVCINAGQLILVN